MHHAVDKRDTGFCCTCSEMKPVQHLTSIFVSGYYMDAETKMKYPMGTCEKAPTKG